MPQDTNNTAEVASRLTALLMTQAGIPIDPDDVHEHPQYGKYDKVAQAAIQYLGAEDYLSLVSALDNDDDGTVLKLVKKANQNKRTETLESVLCPLARSRVPDRDLLARRGFSHVVPTLSEGVREGFMDHLDGLGVRFEFDPDGSFYLDLREGDATAHRVAGYVRKAIREGAHTPVSRMVQNGLFLDWIGDRSPENLQEDEDGAATPASWFDVAFSRSYPHEEKVVAVRAGDADAALRRATEHVETKSKYSSAGYSVEIRPGRRPSENTHVEAVLEHNKMGDVAMRNKQTVNEMVMGMTAVPPLQRMRQLAGLEETVGSLPPYLPTGTDDAGVAWETDLDDGLGDDTVTTTGVVVDDAADQGDAGSAFTQAEAALVTALSLVTEMKISEYLDFCERVSDFAADVREIGRKLRGE